MKPSAISVDNLSFSYSQTPILRNVSFDIKEGECVGVIGPNGGGKSTLMKLICGFLKPATGSIKIFGKKPCDAYNEANPLLAYVPQTLGFDKQFPISTIEVVLSGRLSHLTWWGSYRKADHLAAEEALEKVGLTAFADKPFSTLSGGQAQRILIARALASHPKVMLLDEPTASVDQAAEADIFKLLKSLKEEITFLIVTHDLNQAVDQVDRLLVVQQNVVPMTIKEVCEHFAMGLYHTPMVQADHPLIQIRKPS